MVHEAYEQGFIDFDIRLPYVFNTRGTLSGTALERAMEAYPIPNKTRVEALPDTLPHTIDVVYIASPHASHAALATKALSQGKAVIVEKPIVLSRAELEHIFIAQDKGGEHHRYKPLVFEAMKPRFMPCFKQFLGVLNGLKSQKVAIDTMKLSFCSNDTDGRYATNYLSKTHGGGVVFDVGCHLNPYIWLLDPLETEDERLSHLIVNKSLPARDSKALIDADVTYQFKTVSGTHIQVDASFVRAGKKMLHMAGHDEQGYAWSLDMENPHRPESLTFSYDAKSTVLKDIFESVTFIDPYAAEKHRAQSYDFYYELRAALDLYRNKQDASELWTKEDMCRAADMLEYLHGCVRTELDMGMNYER